MENPIFHKTVSAKTVTVGERVLRNHNKLLWLMEEVDGVKTGYTKAAGRILVSGAQRDGRRIVAVTLDAPDDWNDHQTLMREAFSRYHVQRVVTAGDYVGTMEVTGGEGTQVTVYAAEHFLYALAPDEKVHLVLPGLGFVYAPVVAGADAGFAYVTINGNAVGKVPIRYGLTVERAPEESKHLLENIFGG
jgi:D-alanyl-D-alanine carboxypeptidase